MDTLKETIVAIILAGGSSSRMGRDKALLSIEGIPAIERIYRVAKSIVDSVYIITSFAEKYRSLLPSECIFIEETIVRQGDRSNSPIVGFSQALNYLVKNEIAPNWILLLACDLFCLQATELQKWQQQLLANTNADKMAFLPKNPKGWEALCGFYNISCQQSLDKYIAEGRRSFQGWLSGSIVEELIVTDDRVLFNCNNPAEYASLNSLHSSTKN